MVEEVTAGTWVPASLPVRGSYNRLGTVDMIERDFQTDLLASGFERALAAGRVVLAPGVLADWQRPRESRTVANEPIDRVLEAVECATTQAHNACMFDGRPLCHTLVQSAVYDAVVQATRDASASEEELDSLLASVLPGGAGAVLYEALAASPAETRIAAARALADLHSFSGWAAERGGWTPGKSAGQHDDLDTIRGYQTALRRFESVAWMNAALERAMTAFEEKETRMYPKGYPPRWMHGAGESWYGLVLGGDPRSDRIAWRTLTGLRAALEDTVAFLEPEQLLGEPIELLVVQRGKPRSLDGRSILCLIDGDQVVHLTDHDGCEELLTSPGRRPRLDVDEDALSRLLPPLEPPLARRDALLLRDGDRPAWVTEAHRWDAVLKFASILG
jgi:hypothetical protein